MQGREALRRHATRQYQAETGQKRGQEEQIFNACFHAFVRLITRSSGKFRVPDMGSVIASLPLTTLAPVACSVPETVRLAPVFILLFWSVECPQIARSLISADLGKKKCQ